METNEITTKQTNSCSKSMIEMLEQGMNYGSVSTITHKIFETNSIFQVK